MASGLNSLALEDGYINYYIGENERR